MVKSHESPRIIRPQDEFFHRLKNLPQEVERRGLAVVSRILDNPTSSAEKMYSEIFPNSGERNYSPEELMEKAASWIEEHVHVEKEEGETEEQYIVAVAEKRNTYKQSVNLFIAELFRG